MATIDVKDAANFTVALEKPLTPGRAAAASSRPVALSTEDKASLDLVSTAANQTAVIGTKAPGTAAASSELAGGVYNSGGVTLTTGQQAAIQLDASGNLKVTGGGGGTQFAEDVPHVSGDVGTMALVVRKDTATALAGTDGDYAPLEVDASGRLHVNVGTSALPTGAATETTLNSLLTAATDTSTTNVAQDTAVIKNGATSLTPKFAVITASTSGNNTIVAAVTSKKIRVLDYMLNASGAVNAKFQSGASGTDITGLHYMAAAGDGVASSFSPVGKFESASGVLLNLNLSAAVAVGGWIVYIEV